MSRQPIPVGQLLLDLENPRYKSRAVSSQNAAIHALIDHEGNKLVTLTEHIGRHGMNPADALIVMAKGRNYVVLEGNRRLAAVRLLSRPSLADGTAFAPPFRELAGRYTSPAEVDCSIVKDREEARPWIILRHSGESEGAGVVRWLPKEREAFDARPGTHVDQGLAFIETLREAYPDDGEIQALIAHLEDKRISTVGRLVSDPRFKERLGLARKEDRFVSRYTADALRNVIKKLLSDFATTMTVSTIKNSEQRGEYLDTLTTPDPASQAPTVAPLAATSPSGRKPAAPARPREPRPGPLLKGLVLASLGPRTVAIVTELRRMDPERFPNAAALMLRAVLELGVDQVYVVKGWPIGNTEFRNRIRKCLNEIDPTHKETIYQPIRTGLQDSSSLHSVSTLHAFVHNPGYHPSAGDVRAIAANWHPFLQALNDVV